jgi:ketosteroid isomerase-like protein
VTASAILEGHGRRGCRGARPLGIRALQPRARAPGIDAIRKQHQGWFDSYPDLRVEPLEVRANGDRVFVWAHFSGQGADSGLPMDMELAHVLTIDDEGRTRRLEEFFDRTEALDAAGLGE